MTSLPPEVTEVIEENGRTYHSSKSKLIHSSIAIMPTLVLTLALTSRIRFPER